MTVIAYDGKTLAADRRCCTECGILLSPRRKLIVTERGAVAACGETLSPEADARLVGKIGDGKRMDLDYPCDAFVLLRGGEAFKVQNGHALTLTGPASVGSGHEVALGAMAMGADARRAVEIASALIVTCGDGVDVYAPGQDAA